MPALDRVEVHPTFGRGDLYVAPLPACWALANDLANRLRCGEALLIHCAGGVGRTAMLAVSVLLALGESFNEAENAVSRAGSIVETMAQIEMLSWCAARVSNK